MQRLGLGRRTADWRGCELDARTCQQRACCFQPRVWWVASVASRPRCGDAKTRGHDGRDHQSRAANHAGLSVAEPPNRAGEVAFAYFPRLRSSTSREAGRRAISTNSPLASARAPLSEPKPPVFSPYRR